MKRGGRSGCPVPPVSAPVDEHLASAGRKRLPARLVTRRGFLVGAVTALAATACSSGGSKGSGRPSDSSAGGERRITADEAARLAEMLFADYDAKGATFELNARLPDQSTLRLAGEVDWTRHVGHAMVEATGPDRPITEIYWGPNDVLERIPALSELADQLGRPAVQFVARSGAPAQRHLDAMIGIVTGMAASERENPLLLQQNDSLRWLRSDTVRGVAVDVFRFGDRSVYWLEQGGTALYRFEGNMANGQRPVVIDLLTRGAQDVRGPLATDVVQIALVQELYDATIKAG